MMSQALLARAEARTAENKRLRATPGSGWHDKDRVFDAIGRPFELAPQTRGEPPVDEHLVVFFDTPPGDDDMRLVGPDATRAAAAIESWSEANRGRSPYDLSGTEQKLLYVYIPRTRPAAEDGVPVLKIRRGWWNDFLWLFARAGLGVCGLPLEAA